MEAADLGSGSGETGKEPLLLPVFLKLRDRQVLEAHFDSGRPPWAVWLAAEGG